MKDFKELGRVIGAVILILVLVAYNMYERWEKARYKRLYETQVTIAQDAMGAWGRVAMERNDLQKRVLDLGGMEIRLDVANQIIAERDKQIADLNAHVLEAHGATVELTKKLYTAEDKLRRGLPQPPAEKPAEDCSP